MRYLPGDDQLDVGGDWYDCFELADGCIPLMVGDVNGKGAPAAAVMGRIRAFTLALADRCAGPADLLGAISAQIYERDLSGMATACCLWVDIDNGSVEVARRGAEPAQRRRARLPRA